MSFISNYNQLTAIFDLNHDQIQIPGSKTVIINNSYVSQMPDEYRMPELNDDFTIFENSHFRYPVILPNGINNYKDVIILLHGLNERTWNKHLPGAVFLAEKTGRAVIMFPLSYHINRGLPEWSDARKMSALLEKRIHAYPEVKNASVVNLALSERLTEHPERFYISGVQSALDLIRLLKDIQTGRHRFFSCRSKTDIFCYSISCMMLQSLMISNPDNILSNSRIVFFAGGSLFSHLQGASRFIMDSVALSSIRRFYANVVRHKASLSKGMIPIMMESKFGQAFRAVICADKFKNVREKSIADFHSNLLIIALKDDKVIPLKGIQLATGEKFSKSDHMRIVHFPYTYTHENPFPVLYKKIDTMVNTAFHSVFNPAIEFFMR